MGFCRILPDPPFKRLCTYFWEFFPVDTFCPEGLEFLSEQRVATVCDAIKEEKKLYKQRSRVGSGPWWRAIGYGDKFLNEKSFNWIWWHKQAWRSKYSQPTLLRWRKVTGWKKAMGIAGFYWGVSISCTYDSRLREVLYRGVWTSRHTSERWEQVRFPRNRAISLEIFS